MLYLGIQSFFKEYKLDYDQNNIGSGGISFLQGFSISILNPKIFIWFIAIYSQFISIKNDMFLNISLVLVASVIDALWYVFLVNLVTYKNVLELIKTKTRQMQRIVGILFIIISIMLFISLFS